MSFVSKFLRPKGKTGIASVRGAQIVAFKGESQRGARCTPEVLAFVDQSLAGAKGYCLLGDDDFVYFVPLAQDDNQRFEKAVVGTFRPNIAALVSTGAQVYCSLILTESGTVHFLFPEIDLSQMNIERTINL